MKERENARILIVDDDPGNADYISRVLRNYTLRVFTSSEQALKHFRENQYDLVVSDQKMPGLTGIEMIKACKKISEDFLGIIISAYTDSDDLIDAVNSNVIYRYIIKPFMPDTLLQNVHRAYESLSLIRRNKKLEQLLQEENVRLQKENTQLKGETSNYGLERIAGHSRVMVKLKEKISTYANSSSSILITGETGTGKELVAKALHELSERSLKPFIKINCATLSPSIIESELFGYQKGSFTGAETNKKGFFETAHQGTIFLDEIGDLSLEMQPKLLRIIQFGTYFPVGGRVEKYADVRLIAATNVPLEKYVALGTFRKDLYHRINILRLRIPPLRERREDIMEIFNKILEREYGTGRKLHLSPDAQMVLINRSFPGNIRELETYIHRLALLNIPDGNITLQLLNDVLEPLNTVNKENSIGNTFDESGSLKLELEEMEKNRIEKSLRENNYNITRTAELLGLSRQGLHNKINRYKLYRE